MITIMSGTRLVTRMYCSLLSFIDSRRTTHFLLRRVMEGGKRGFADRLSKGEHPWEPHAVCGSRKHGPSAADIAGSIQPSACTARTASLVIRLATSGAWCGETRVRPFEMEGIYRMAIRNYCQFVEEEVKPVLPGRADRPLVLL